MNKSNDTPTPPTGVKKDKETIMSADTNNQLKTVIQGLMNHLPDTRNQSADDTWEYCWEALSCDAQTSVAQIRRMAREYLRDLEACDSCGSKDVDLDGNHLCSMCTVKAQEANQRDSAEMVDKAIEQEETSIMVTDLLEAVKELYFAGHWMSDTVGDTEAMKLWENLRDAAGITPGSATRAGLGQQPDAELGYCKICGELAHKHRDGICP